MQVQYEIPTHKLDELRKIVERVAKRAVKMNLPTITFDVVSVRPCRVYRIVTESNSATDYSASMWYRYIGADDEQLEVGTECYQNATVTITEVGATELHTVVINGEQPYLSGHVFLASIDHGGADETNVVNTVPGVEAHEGLVADWLHAAADCQHCGLNRRRLNTYLLRKDDGTVVQVGSTCIKDYFPGTAADDIAALANLWIVIDLAATGGSDDFEGYRDSGSAGGWLREDVLAVAAANIRAHGWTSKAAAENGGTSTATRVSQDPTSRRGEKHTPVTVMDEDVDKAERVIAWVDAIDPYTTNDYLCNLRSATGRKITTPKLLGIVVSAVGAMDRDEAKRIEREAQNATMIPVPEGRFEVTGRVLSTKEVPGFNFNTYVWKVLVLVDSSDGSWKTYGTAPCDAEVGDTIRFTARFTRSADDENFGFFSRPSKGRKVS